MKRTLTLLLALLMVFLACSLASCNKQADNPDADTTSPSNSSDNENDGSGDDYDLSRFDGIDLGDATEVHILSRGHERHRNEITCEDSSDEILHSIYVRQLTIEEKLGIKLINDKVEETDEHGGRGELPVLVNSGDTTYSIYASSYYGSSNFAVSGLFTDLYDVPNLDTNRSYWSSYFTEKSQIGNSLYMITGDAAISATRFLFVTFFNKQLINDYGIEDPFALVQNKEWTYDKMFSIVKDIYVDTNNNGEKDAEDTFGLGLNNYLGVDAYTSAFDLMCVRINEEKKAELSVDVNKYSDATNKLYTLFWQTDGVLNKQDPDNLAKIFSENRLVFSQSWLYNVESIEMRNMKNGYGIIPYPLYNSDQEDYYTFGHDQITIFAVPKTCVHTDAAGAVLELMAAASKSTVINQYYEIALKYRYAPDPTSSAMLDLIRDNFLLDTGWVYCENLELVSRMLRTLIENKSNNFASYYAKYSESFEQAIDKLNTDFGFPEG